jgi:hypothetical protein
MKHKTIYYIAIIFVIIIIIFSIIGYTYYADVEAISKTKVEIENIDLININPNSIKLGLIVKFINPSDREITDLSSNFKIYVDSNYIGRGSFSNINIKQQSYTSKQVSITIAYSDLAQSTIDIINNFIKGEKTMFSIQGKITADVLFGSTETSHCYTAYLN